MKNKRDNRLRLFVRPKTRLTLSPSAHDILVTEEYGSLVDLESGCWAAVLGHSKDTLKEAIKDLKYPVHTHHFFDSSHFDKLVRLLTDLCRASGSLLRNLFNFRYGSSITVCHAFRISHRQAQMSEPYHFLSWCRMRP